MMHGKSLACIFREFPGALKKKFQEIFMTDRECPLCDCDEPYACYAEGYAAGKDKAFSAW